MSEAELHKTACYYHKESVVLLRNKMTIDTKYQMAIEPHNYYYHWQWH